jgi:hypothetical protein
MQFSPCRPLFHRKLYRNRLFAVTLAVSATLGALPLGAQILGPQYGRKAAIDKGPRAIGLVQLLPKGSKGRLVPIAIMLDGKFYDAGSYKAAPVPMALDFDTVYEGFRAGISQGIFTVTQPGQLNHVWIAEGTWLPAGMKAPEKSKKYSTPVIEDKDAPPVLHRHSGNADTSPSGDKDKDKDRDQGTDKEKDQSKTPNADQKTADQKKDDQKPANASTPPDAVKASSPPESAKASPTADDETIADPNRPRLRRGKPDSTSRREPFTTFDEMPAAKPGAAATTSATDAKTKDSSGSITPPTFIPAISDAGGPDPRPYVYDMKPAEEAGYLSKMLDLAAAQLHPKASAAKEAATSHKKSFAGKSTGKSSQPALDNVSMHVFDLSNSNEPILVLSAKTRPSAPATGSIEEPQEITLIARTNLEGEVKKLFFAETDSHHLDVSPRMELIDAVDADGDGRGELLFRRTSDDGSSYAIYRVTADGLWPLFEGTP